MSFLAHHYLLRAAWLLPLLLLTSCGGDGSDDDDEFVPTVFDSTSNGGVLRFVNSVPDSPTLQIAYTASFDGSGGVTELSFGEAMTVTPVASGYDIVVFYENPAGEPVVLLELLQDPNDEDIEVAVDEERTLVLGGLLNNLEYRVIEREEYLYGLDIPEEGTSLVVDPQVHFVHAAWDVGSLDVYITQAQIALSNSNPTATLEYLEASDIVELEPRNDYRIRVTPAGMPGDVLYDSGEFSLTASSRRFYPIYNYFGAGPSEVQVKSVTNTDSTFPEDELPTAFRLGSLVADLHSVDVHLGNTDGEPLVPALEFQALTDFMELESGTYILNITPEGIDNQFLYQGEINLLPGTIQTFIVSGLESDESEPDFAMKISGVLYEEDIRPISSAIRVRAVHGSASGGALDIYLLIPGQTTFDTDPAYAGIAQGGASLSEINPGFYDLLIVEVESEAEVFGPERIELTAGNLYTLVISDTSGGGTPLDIRLIASTSDPN